MTAKVNKRTRKPTQVIVASAAISLFRALLIFGLCYIILKPFLTKILAGFMSPKDLFDVTVEMIPRNWSTYYYQHAFRALNLSGAGLRTLQLSLLAGVLQVVSSALIGYGLGRFKFPGRSVGLGIVMIIMLMPPQVTQISQYLQFRFFSIGLLQFDLIDTIAPVALLSAVGMGLKHGLYIFMMRVFFMGLPRDLESAAYIDGAGIFRTFISVILPNARTLLLTIFFFSFSWHWTDTAFTSVYMPSVDTLSKRLISSSMLISSIDVVGSAISRQAGLLLVLIPLIVLFVFFQRSLVQGISTSGLAN